MGSASLDNMILKAYTDRRYHYPTMYRYIDMDEFDRIFLQRIISFTNPDCWRNTAGDARECFFENWWNDDGNIKLLIQNLMISTKAKWDTPVANGNWKGLAYPVWQRYIKCLLSLLRNKNCLCLATDWTDQKMKENYHIRRNRNVVLEIASDFMAKLAPLPKEHPQRHTHLYIDVFPMEYISDLNVFCERLCSPGILSDTDEWEYYFFNKGCFLKHDSFQYENEIRITLNRYDEDINDIIFSPELINDTFRLTGSTSLESDLFKLYDKYRQRILAVLASTKVEEHKIVRIPNSVCLKEIVTKVIVSDKCSSVDVQRIEDIVQRNNIQMEIMDFDSYSTE